MDKIKYWKSAGDTMNRAMRGAITQKIDDAMYKNFYNLADLDAYIDNLLEMFKKESGLDGAYIWKSENWGTQWQFSYYSIRVDFLGKTYNHASGCIEYIEVEIN